MIAQALTLAEATRIVREAVRDKTYQLMPLGGDAVAYLRAKRKRLTDSSFRDYEASLDKFVRFFMDLRLEDFEPPIGVERLEEFLDEQWGDQSPRTYNKNLSILSDFFDWQVRTGHLHGDPTTPIERAKAREVYRTTYTEDQCRAVIAAQDDVRDRLALRLVLHYGLRKGSLQKVQFKHFDHVRKRLTLFLKRGKVRELPIPQPDFWHDLERHILDAEAQSGHFLLPRQKMIPRAGLRRFPEAPMGVHGLHNWWYRCLANAGITPQGVTRGEHMHKGRHTAGQRILDRSGNLKAVQALLHHESITTTADCYVDWDIDRLAGTLAEALSDE